MNIVADIGNSQIKIAIDRKDSISRAKTFRLIDFVSVKKYLKSLQYDGKSELFYSSVLFPFSGVPSSENLYLWQLKPIVDS